MKYGNFDPSRREYVITDPRTPVKWINYVGTLAFGGFVDQTGGSLICKGDPALNRIVKYLPQLPDSDFKGETLYLRIHQPGAVYRVFSPYYTPTLDPFERYACHVGLGYSRIVSEFYGLRTDATIFVPPGESVLLRLIRITNLRETPVRLDAVPVVEYTHFDALKQFTNADWVPQTMQSDCADLGEGRIALLQYPFMLRDTRVNYFTASLPISSYDSDRRVFLGANGYGTWHAPLSLQQPELNNTQARRGDNIAALLVPLEEVLPGETRTLITLLGQSASLEAARPAIEKYREPAAVEAALNSLTAFWGSMLARLQVETPDASMDDMLNVHNPRQVYVTKNWSRYLSLYQLGFGARGIGFRDSSQDVMGVLALAPEEGRELIRLLLQVQKRDGSAMHQFNPLTMIGNAGDSLEVEEGPHYYSDDHLWIVLAVCAYLKETGDLAFLEENLPFYDKDRRGQPHESGSVLEHLRRAVEFTANDTGARGLPLLGFADWNDTVNLPAGAESCFTANLYGKALLEMIELAGALDDRALRERCERRYREMEERFNRAAWDGEWYIRYFDAEGRPLGSRQNQHGQIFLNAQSWAVISGFAPPEMARQAMDSAHRRLNTAHGLKLSAPGYDGYDPQKGGVTTYPPGAKENGGIFLHANPWAMIAAAMLGDGERAYQYYRQINPASRNDRIEEFECEPYVYPQNILGDEHHQFGLARNSWLTGTASWAYQAATQYILGVRPAYDGLRIDPCIPPDWAGFKVRRFFRGAWYEIEVFNPSGAGRGVASLRVDSRPVDGQVIPVFADGAVHRVQVQLGLT